MRAFLAIALPDEVRSALGGLKDQLAASGADVKWVDTEQLHLTLKFLGDITEPQRVLIASCMAEIGGRCAPYSMTLHAVGAFPSMTSPRVVWVDIREGRAQMERLAQLVEHGAATLGWARDTRPFAAHITLGRVRSSRRRQMLSVRLRQPIWQPPGMWRVESLRLYQSVLGAAGPRYTVLEEFPLCGEISRP